jgi:hypothetical protein
MRSWAGFVSLAVLVLAFAGCGKTVATTGATTAATTSSPPVTTKITHPHVKSATYAVNLAGIKRAPTRAPTPRRAPKPKGSAFAAISINGSSNELCWTFSQLKNLPPAPYEAQLRGDLEMGVTVTELSNAKGQYTASGCYSAPPELLDLIERHPHSFHLKITKAGHPERGVEGLL